MEPQIHFCTSADGTRIAYATLGEGPALVRVPGGFGNLERYWEHPDCRGFMQGLATGRRLVVLDQRGVGASQREVDEFALAAQVADVAALVDHLQLERFDLWGSGDGAQVAVAYAAQHPERVSRLVLWSPYARGGDITTPEVTHSLVELVRGNWSLARRAMAGIIFPNGPIEAQRWYSDSLREGVSPEVAAKYIETAASLDITPFLAQVKAPTLVLHRRRARTVPTSAVRAAAALIPDARFVPLDGDIGHALFGDSSWVETVTQFLDEGRVAPVAEKVAGAMVTLLLTDMEGSTDLTQRLGDAGAQEVLRTHNSIIRDALEAHSGQEIKHTGDGIMASFPSASSALEAAVAIQKALADHNTENTDTTIRVRIGLNAGEPVAEDDDLFGTAVQLAARVCAQAEPGQILTSNVVQELAAGKGFDFADKGEATLKGFEKPVRLHEVRWED